jgi:hypothetical protein
MIRDKRTGHRVRSKVAGLAKEVLARVATNHDGIYRPRGWQLQKIKKLNQAASIQLLKIISLVSAKSEDDYIIYVAVAPRNISLATAEDDLNTA